MRSQWLLFTGMALAMVGPPSVYGEPVAVRATGSRDNGTKVSIFAQDQSTTVNITCPVGIDHALLERVGQRWPNSIVLRMHLKGLESFEATSGAVTLLVSVPSTGEPVPHVSLRRGGVETALDKSSPYWNNVRIVGGPAKIPLTDGHFEITLQAKLLEGNPPSIQLRWVDFYRN
ncbi:MAG: hypothetical protein K8T91_04985 [Planctomycetes bacterium]|nr:hypothetical protein [Planctomycetota bacterium]